MCNMVSNMASARSIYPRSMNIRTSGLSIVRSSVHYENLTKNFIVYVTHCYNCRYRKESFSIIFNSKSQMNKMLDAFNIVFWYVIEYVIAILFVFFSFQ